MFNMIYAIVYVAATVSFAQSSYSVNETDEVVQVEIILSNLSSNNIVVQVGSSDVTAIGEQKS